MSIRLEKKQQTRQALMDAALAWVAEGQDLSSVSIREVAKRAGVVPTAFYRHFSDMNDLALNLVDELSIVLRQLMRETRQKTRVAARMIQDSVTLYAEQVAKRPALFRFMSQALSGGSPALRRSVHQEIRYFARELEADIKLLNLLPNLPPDILQAIALLVINTVASTTVELLDTPPNQPADRDQVIQRTIRQLQVVFLGAAHWLPN